MMWIRFFLLGLILYLFPVAGWAQTQARTSPDAGFFSELPDIPVMPGMEEDLSRAVAFDKPGGRIIESTAVSIRPDIVPASVEGFYDTTLPQLGWTVEKKGHFLRQDERLSVSPRVENGLTTVKIGVEPR